MLRAPMNGDTLLLDKAMLGSTEGTNLSASGEMKIRGGRDYDTFLWNDTAYLGKYQIIPGRLADGYPLGWGKRTGDVVKNHYPKGLRKERG